MKLLLDEMNFLSKPKGYEIGQINKRIVNCEVDITPIELAHKIVKGKTFVPSTLKRVNGVLNRKKDNWYSQHIVALDFDDGISLDEALEHSFVQNYASFIYTTFSHTSKKNKFRIVFSLDKPIYSYKQFEQIINYLFEKMPQADKQCKDGVRLFFGGKDLYEVNYNNTLKVDYIVRQKNGFSSDIEYISNMSDEKPPSFIPSQKPKTISDLLCTNIKLIKNNDIINLQKKLNTKSIVLSNMNEVHNYLKQQNLTSFLGVVSNNFYDIFHDEDSPSASVFQSHLGNGHYLYKCHSKSFPFCGTIIQIVERLQRCSIVQAENFLMEVYKIKLIETEAQKEMKRTLDANKRLLTTPELELLYPNFEKITRPYRKDLYILFDLVKEYLPAGDNPKMMFYHSIRELAKKFNVKHDSANRRMNLFVFLELIFKYDEKDIPEELSIELNQRKQRNGYKYRSSVYEIPDYSYDLLSIIESKCKLWIEKGCTLKTINYEGILRNFGRDEADKAFPQDKGKEIKELNKNITNKLRESLLELISHYGYTTEKEVIENVTLYFKGQHQFKQHQLKRCLGELMDKYSLIRVRLNKKLKEKLQFHGAGYPFIIVFQHDLEEMNKTA